jgi:hypothetical protein
VKVVPVGLSQVVQLVAAHVHTSRGNLMQLGFPNMGAGFVYQRYIYQAFAPQAVA